MGRVEGKSYGSCEGEGMNLDELERALVPMDKTLSVRQERYGMARVGVEHAPGAVEVVGEFVLLKHAKEYAALRNAAPKLIAMARRYQWLREHTVATGLSRWVHPHQFLDAAIDAAMQEQKR